MLRIVALGDSLTYGYGIPRGFGFVERLKQAFPETEIYNFGMPGDTAKGIAARSREVLARLHPDLLLLLAGTNDILNGEMPFITEQAFADVWENCRKAGTQLILLGMPEIAAHPGYFGWFNESEAPRLHKNLADLREKLQAFAEKRDLLYLPLSEALKDLPEEYCFLEDGVHLTEEAHEKIADFLTGFLQEKFQF